MNMNDVINYLSSLPKCDLIDILISYKPYLKHEKYDSHYDEIYNGLVFYSIDYCFIISPFISQIIDLKSNMIFEAIKDEDIISYITTYARKLKIDNLLNKI